MVSFKICGHGCFFNSATRGGSAIGLEGGKTLHVYICSMSFFLLLVLTIAVSIFVVATFFLVPSMQQVMAENIIVDEQPEKLHGQDHRPWRGVWRAVTNDKRRILSQTHWTKETVEKKSTRTGVWTLNKSREQLRLNDKTNQQADLSWKLLHRYRCYRYKS